MMCSGAGLAKSALTCIVRVHTHLHLAAAAAISTQNLFPDLQTGPLPPQNVSIQMCGLFINKMCGLNAGLGH